MIKCSNCGNELSENAKFCVACGSKIEAVNAQTDAQNAPPTMPQPQPQQPTTPSPTQFSSPPQQQYNSGGVATKQKNNKPIIFIAIGVVALIVIALIFTLAANLFSGGSSDDPNIGVWTADEITMMGMTLSPTDIYSDGITLELKNGNNCTLSLDGESYSADYEIDGSTFTLVDGSDEFPGRIEGGVITITNLLNMGIDIRFVKDDWNAEQSENDASLGGATLGENGDFSSDFVAPGFGTEQTVAVETLSTPSDWYGTVTISNYQGDNDISGEYEAWGYIGADEFGDYFELYADAPVDSEQSIDIMSFNIELHDYSFFPIVDEYAWLYRGASLKEEDNTWYVPSITNGVLGATYEYDYNGESFTLDFAIAMIPGEGTSDSSEIIEDIQDAEDTSSPIEPEPQVASFTMDELKKIYYDIQDVEIEERFSLEYEEVRDRFFDGIDGAIINEGDTFKSYRWISIEAETSLLNITFKSDDSVEMTFSSMSINNIPLDE